MPIDVCGITNRRSANSCRKLKSYSTSPTSGEKN